MDAKAILIAAACCAAGVAQAQMFKCVVNGKVVYQQSACQDERNERGIGGTTTTIDAMPQREINRVNNRAAQERARDERTPKMSVIGGSRPATPSDQDIKNLETSASSKTISDKERKFLQQEVERARAAQQGNGSYTQKNLEQLKDAQSAQNRIDPRDREQARTAAENIHINKGSAAVQDEVVQSRQAEEARKEARRAAVITSCDAGGCWGSDGSRYNRSAGDNFVRQDGRFCQVVGKQMTCH